MDVSRKNQSTKKMVSDLKINLEVALTWVEEVMASLGETNRTIFY